METKTNSTLVVFRNITIGYAHLLEPSAIQGSTNEPKYSCVVLIPKTDKEAITAYKNAVNEAISIGVQKKWGGKKPAILKLPLRDGDKEKPDNPEYKGMVFINTSSKIDRKPEIVDRRRNPITDPNEIYSGMVCNVAVNFYPFNKAGNIGIAAGLGALQKVSDGERLSGGVSAQAIFEDEGEDPYNDYPEGDEMDFNI